MSLAFIIGTTIYSHDPYNLCSFVQKRQQCKEEWWQPNPLATREGWIWDAFGAAVIEPQQEFHNLWGELEKSFTSTIQAKLALQTEVDSIGKLVIQHC